MTLQCLAAPVQHVCLHAVHEGHDHHAGVQQQHCIQQMEAHAVQQPHVHVVQQRQQVHGNVRQQLRGVEKLLTPLALQRSTVQCRNKDWALFLSTSHGLRASVKSVYNKKLD